jgi:hypothetical protein
LTTGEVRESVKDRDPVFLYEVDLELDIVRRKVKKHCFSTKPWEYLKEASNGSLPLEIQAAYQVARPVLESLRESRMLITRSMTAGTKSWRTAYARLKSFEQSLEDWDGSQFLRIIYQRYCRFCRSEIVFCQRQITLILGAKPLELQGQLRNSEGRKPSFLMRAAQ